MLIVGIDPGLHSPAHVLIDTDSARVLEIARKPIPLLVGRVFVEGQQPRPSSSRQSLMTLSFYAGLHAGAYLTRVRDVHVLPVDVWREAVLRRSARLPKTVFQARVAKQTPREVIDAGEDAIDAYWIAVAGATLTKLPKPVTWSKACNRKS